MKLNRKQIILVLLSGTGLLLVFLFQKTSYFTIFYTFLSGEPPVDMVLQQYLFDKIFRFLVNDALAILMVHALFNDRKYTLFAVGVQVFGMLFILVPYLILRTYYPEYQGAIVSHLHRLVLNPTLLMLLIPAFLYQKQLQKGRGKD